MRAALPSLPDKREQPVQDPGERQGTTPPLAATASGLPSAATASGLVKPAAASKVESMKVEGHTPPASGIVKAAAASGLPSAATVSRGLASATPAIDVENIPRGEPVG